MSALHEIKRWVKAADHPAARLILSAHRTVRTAEVPPLRFVYSPLLALYRTAGGGLGWLARIFFWTPMFKTRLAGPARRLYLYGGMPYLSGPLHMEVGADCRISAATTFSGRWAGNRSPKLIIGDRVGVGWQTTIAVGTRVVLGNDVRIAGRSFLAGYPGHPLDARDRAAGLPDTEDQIGDIVLEDDVWLGTGVSVMAGVCIGRGTVVAAGSVVTRDLPPGVIAAGMPAKVVRELPAGQGQAA